MSLMMSSCCTFRLKRRRALSMDSPSWTFTSATLIHPLQPASRDDCPEPFGQPNVLGYHTPAAPPAGQHFPAVPGARSGLDRPRTP